jgi:hypothetical protein
MLTEVQERNVEKSFESRGGEDGTVVKLVRRVEGERAVLL